MPRLLTALTILVAAACASTLPPRNALPSGLLHVGVAEVDITPDEPIRLSGYGNRAAPSERVEGRLKARALAFGSERQRTSVLITADLVGVPRHLTEGVARRLEDAGIDRSHVTIAATHTHNGPALAGMLPFIFSAPVPAEQQAVIDGYTQTVAEQLEAVARAALKDRRPSRVAWGQASAGFAANRRVLKGGTWTGFGVNPEGPVDRDLPVLTVRSPDGALRAVLVGYACHATTLEAKDNFIHGDWPGAAAVAIQKRHPGAVALVMIGAGADANPSPRGGGLPHVQRHAAEVADAVDRLLGGALRPLTTLPEGRHRYIDLQFRDLPSRAQLEAAAAKPDAAGRHARALLARLDSGQGIPDSVAYWIQTWTWGDDLAMVFLGGEVVADYSLRLKRELDRSRLWVTAYANDVPFYVASERMIREGGYEVDRSMIYYGQPGPLAAGSEERVIGSVRELLPRAFGRR